MLRWAVGRDYLTGEPWRGIELPPRSEPRRRVLNAREVRWLWEMTGKWIRIGTEKQRYRGRILRLLLLTGQRSSEVCRMERSEVGPDALTFTLAAERSKNSKAHTVPLPPLARQILKEAIAESPSKTHVFSGPRAPARHDDLYHDLVNAIAEHNAGKPEAEGIPPFIVHDLRKTVAGALEAMRVPMPVIAATLNHVSTKNATVTTRHYAHGINMPTEVRIALAQWQGTVQNILAGNDPLTTKLGDIADLEAHAIAQGFGGRPNLQAAE
jgi:integrase